MGEYSCTVYCSTYWYIGTQYRCIRIVCTVRTVALAAGRRTSHASCFRGRHGANGAAAAADHYRHHEGHAMESIAPEAESKLVENLLLRLVAVVCSLGFGKALEKVCGLCVS